jgi:hypothetical protein
MRLRCLGAGKRTGGPPALGRLEWPCFQSDTDQRHPDFGYIAAGALLLGAPSKAAVRILTQRRSIEKGQPSTFRAADAARAIRP